jgi:hypothetical protein
MDKIITTIASRGIKLPNLLTPARTHKRFFLNLIEDYMRRRTFGAKTLAFRSFQTSHDTSKVMDSIAL